jgi:predicted metal-dependent TIM-barrel fold hydrolase
MIDHAEEHTLEMILGNGFWTGLTLYPQTKVSPERAIDMLERRGPERICVASACDWGPSVPTAVPQFMLAMRRRGHDEALIRRVAYENPAAFLGQSPKFRLRGEPAVAGAQAAPTGQHHGAGEPIGTGAAV